MQIVIQVIPEACFQESELKRFFHSDHAVTFLLLRIQKLI